jgi:hypothetical protein
MRLFIITIFIILLCVCVQAQETKKANRPLDIGVELSADPNIHQAVYAVLEAKGISCTGLSTRKDGTVTVLQASDTKPLITAAEIQAEINKIKAAQDIEVLIADEMRELAIQSLKDKGKIDKNYKDK